MKIVTLIENQTDSDLLCEHGLSFYIEYHGTSYLLDAGQSELFATNAKALGIDLAGVDKAILSHAHYDHAGGFVAFADINSKAPVFMQKAAKLQCFSEKPEGMKDIGIPAEVRRKLEGRVCYVDGDCRLEDDISLIAHHAQDLSGRGRQMHMFTQEGDNMQVDDFAHEQSLVFELPKGLMLFNSCSHGGVDLVLEEVQRAFGGRRVLAMIGGFHLMGSAGPDSMRESEQEVRALASKLRSMQVDKIYTGHCTGTKAFLILKEELGDRLEVLVTGRTIEL